MADELLMRAAVLDMMSAPLDRIEAATVSLDAAISHLGKTALGTAAETEVLAASQDGLNRKLKTTQSFAERAQGKLQSLATNGLRDVMRWAERAAFGIAVLTAVTIAYGSHLAIQNEQFKIALVAMLGSAGAAEDLYYSLQKFAELTPFTFNGLKPLTQQLLGAGFAAEDVIPILRGLGDVVAGVGGSEATLARVVQNLQQIQAAGKLDGRQMRDFAMNGIPALEQLSKKLGMTKAQFQDMMGTAGGGRELFDRLGGGRGIAETLGSGRFAGLMDKQSRSVGGMLSNVKDAFQNGLAEGMEGLFPILKPKLEALQRNLAPWMARFGANFGKAFRAFGAGDRKQGGQLMAQAFGLSPAAGRVIEKVAGLIGDVIRALKENGPAIAKLVGTVLLDLTILALRVLPTVIRVLGSVARAMKPIVDIAFVIVNAIITVVQWIEKLYAKLMGLGSHLPGWVKSGIKSLSGGIVDFDYKVAKTPKSKDIGALPDYNTFTLAAPSATPSVSPTSTTSHSSLRIDKMEVNGATAMKPDEFTDTLDNWWSDKVASTRERG